MVDDVFFVIDGIRLCLALDEVVLGAGHIVEIAEIASATANRGRVPD